jgi:hypothetical protein
VSKVDTVVRALAGVTVVGLAGIAGAISYSHMTELDCSRRAHDRPTSPYLMDPFI